MNECLDAATILEEPIAMSSKADPSTIEGRFEAESKKVFPAAAIGLWLVVDLVSAQLVPIRRRQRQCLQSVFWRSFTSARNVPFLDLFPLFINSADPEVVIDKYFIPGDPHWNRKGHRLVADAFSVPNFPPVDQTQE